MGSGTTSVAAVKLGLEVIGIEKGAAAFTAAKEHLTRDAQRLEVRLVIQQQPADG